MISHWVHLLRAAGAVRGHRAGAAKLQGRGGRVDDVATHIAQRPAAEIEETPPLHRTIDVGHERPPGADAQPEVPVQFLGHGAASRGSWAALRPDHPADPAVHLFDAADRPGLDELRRHAVADVRVDLNAHLRDDLRFAGSRGNLPGLVERMRQWLLAIDVLAAADGRHRDWGMHVIGRRNAHGVDLLLQRVEEPAEVGEGLRRRILGRGLGQDRLVDIAQADHIDRPFGEAGDIASALPAHADRGDIQASAGRHVSIAAQHVAGNDLEAQSGGGCFQKTAAFHGEAGLIGRRVGREELNSGPAERESQFAVATPAQRRSPCIEAQRGQGRLPPA